MPKLRHYDHLNSARFITYSCYHFLPYLSTPESRDIFVTHLQAFRIQTGVLIYGFVLMPEHVHLVLHPPDNFKLGKIIGVLKRASMHELREYWHRPHGTPIWQQRGFDHNCLSEDDAIKIINYCHQNPVRRGLVNHATDWKWSSARWYEGMRDEGLQIDAMGSPNENQVKNPGEERRATDADIA